MKQRRLPITLADIGFLILLFVLIASVLSLAWDVVVPLSVAANRGLLALLALGCLLSRL